ncbi:hypothetical protein PaeBR_20105 [Paenibacillus sp. BR2-3]
MNKDKQIILIEDEPSHALLYKYKLLTEGYNVVDLRGTDATAYNCSRTLQ